MLAPLSPARDQAIVHAWQGRLSEERSGARRVARAQTAVRSDAREHRPPGREVDATLDAAEAGLDADQRLATSEGCGPIAKTLSPVTGTGTSGPSLPTSISSPCTAPLRMSLCAKASTFAPQISPISL